MLRIGSLLVHGMPSTAVTQQDRLKYLGTLVNLESSALVSALGALLNVMQTRGVACSHLAGEDEQVSDAFRGPTHVQMLKEVPLHGGLVLDNATLKGLQIFVNEQHPSNMGIGKAKEGFSIYGMFFSHAQTGMVRHAATARMHAALLCTFCALPTNASSIWGKRLLRSWLLRPIVNAAVINDRQNAVELLVKSPDVLAELKTTLKKIHDVPRLVQRLSFVGKPDLALFRMLSSSLQQLLLLRSTILSLAPDVDSCAITQQVTDEAHAHLSTHVGWGAVSISHKLLAHILPELQACQDLIESVIDFELGADREADMLIRYDVCNELDNLKDVYFGLPDLLTKARIYSCKSMGPANSRETKFNIVLEAELQRVPSFLAQDNTKQLWSIVYLPLCGFVMQISGEPLTDDLLMELSDYTLAMEGHADDGAPSAYYHTDTTRSLNDQVGDVLYKIKDLEGSLCCELSRRLLSYSTQLHLASAVVAELDCLMAFAACASDHNYCRPELSAENVLHIEGGRHPLAELVVSSFIPNATCMPATQPRVHVISGPNASGKSCYIKQVATIAYLAHLGAWVPATSATVGITDRIYTRLVSHQSSLIPQSSFMVDLSQILCMLKSSTERSILVVDEFGKGTCAADGEGLLAAFLNHYTGMQHPPRCLVATHFVELFNTSVLPRSPQLAFYMMDATTASKNDDGLMCDPDHGEWETTFLYRLVQGQQSPSFGIHCAKTLPKTYEVGGVRQAHASYEACASDDGLHVYSRDVSHMQRQAVCSKHCGSNILAPIDAMIIDMVLGARLAAHLAKYYMCGLPGDVLQRAHQVVASQQLGVALPTVPSSDAASTRHDELVQRLRQLNLQSCSWQTSAGILLHDVAGSASK
eukprot:344517-Chlamydomonas_euryale.AAC.13